MGRPSSLQQQPTHQALCTGMERGLRVSDFDRVGSGQCVRPGFEFILTNAFIVALFLQSNTSSVN